MDQESFRRLLQTPHAGSSSSSRGSLLSGFGGKAKVKVIDASQPAFKPRKVKKTTDSRYRDRAAERRVGEGNDYAEVESVLEDFEKRHANTEDKTAVEEQRRYLGGDGDHSILVKGLDVALLEQNRARAAMSTEDDDLLEEAFLEASSEAVAPKKRTREDLIRELKEKRAQNGGAVEEVKMPKTVEEEALLLEEAKKKGKFKPIGFKSIGAPEEAGKKKKKKVVGDTKDAERKKKRRKIVEDETVTSTTTDDKPRDLMPPPPAPVTTAKLSPRPAAVEHEPEPEEEVDIFAGAGEYNGLDSDNDDDIDDEDEHPTTHKTDVLEAGEEKDSPKAPHRWIEVDDPGPAPVQPNLLSSTLKSHSSAPGPEEQDEDVDEAEQPVRLVPLASSALPSIKDFLAMDDAAGSSKKRRKRKDKKGNNDEDSKKRAVEAKVDRDYKRLKSYTDKKAEVSK